MDTISTKEIITGILLILCCICIVILCLCQDNKSQNGMTSAFTGSSTDSFYGKNEGRTKEAKLIKATRVGIIIFFVLTLAINIMPLIGKD